MNLRFNYDETGLLIPRRIDSDAALLALTQLLTRAPTARPHVPPTLLDTFDRLVAEAALLKERLLAWTAPEAPDDGEVIEPTMAIPEALVGLAEEAVLRSSRGVNNLLDVWVAALANGLETYAVLTGEPGAAARRLRELWFSNGRTFLSFNSQRQWLAIHQRWGNLSPADSATLERLGLASHRDTVVALNAWFGRILHLTEAQTEAVQPPATDNPMPEALDFLCAVMQFAGLAWRGSSAEAAERRRLLCGPYLDELRAISERASQAARKRDKAADAPAPAPN